MKANVISLPPRAISMPLDRLDSFHGRRMIAKLLREWLRGHDDKGRRRTLNSLAKRANLYPTTVAKIASETTKWPRLHTILAVMAGIGFTAVRFE